MPTIVELAPNGCRYIGKQRGIFCGEPQKAKSAYCAHHHGICWVRGNTKIAPARNWRFPR